MMTMMCIVVTVIVSCTLTVIWSSSVEASSYIRANKIGCDAAFVFHPNHRRNNHERNGMHPNPRSAPFAPPLLTTPTTTASTELHMGIRDFFRNNLAIEDDDDDDDDENSTDETDDPSIVREALEAIRADLEAVQHMDDDDDDNNNNNGPSSLKNRTRRGPIRYSLPDEPAVEPVVEFERAPLVVPSRRVSPPPPSSVDDETVEQRIRRLRSGSMTEQEKVRFLQTAMSPSDVVKGKQQPEVVADAKEKGGRKGAGRGGNGKDGLSQLWNVIGSAGGKSSKPSQGSTYRTKSRDATGDAEGSTEMSDSAKRDYFAMVTDPNRFQSYATVRGAQKATDDTKPQQVQDGDDETPIDPAAEPIDTTVPPPEEHSESGEDADEQSDLPTITPDSTTIDDNNADLATRLAEDAVLQARVEDEARAQRERQQQIEADRLAAIETELEEERVRLEEKKLETLRLTREAEDRRVEEERRAEEERMERVVVAQEKYWKDKLEEERRFKEEREKVSDNKMDVRAISKDNSKVIKDTPPISTMTKVTTSIPTPTPTPPPPSDTATTISTPPKPPVPGKTEVGKKKPDSTFIREQERKRAEIERRKAEYRQSVSDMNSPITSGFSPNTPLAAPKKVAPRPVTTPSLSLGQLTRGKEAVPSKVVPAVTPVSPSEPNTVAPPSTPSSSSSSVSSRLSIAQLMGGNKPKVEDATPVTPATPTPPPQKPDRAASTSSRLSLAQLLGGNKPKVKDAEPATTAVTPPRPTESDGAAPRLSLAELTMGKNKRVGGDDDGGDDANDGGGGGATEERRVIRQRVPLGDDEPSERSNEELSLKAIMARRKLESDSEGGSIDEDKKKKAKNYGIDLDKLF